MFPSHIFQGNSRHFQYSWLGKYPGLLYSMSEDDGFCKVFLDNAKLKRAWCSCKQALTNFKRATERLSEHFYNASNTEICLIE